MSEIERIQQAIQRARSAQDVEAVQELEGLLAQARTQSALQGAQFNAQQGFQLDPMSEQELTRNRERYFANQARDREEQRVGLTDIAGQSLGGAIEAAPSGIAAAAQAGRSGMLQQNEQAGWGEALLDFSRMNPQTLADKLSSTVFPERYAEAQTQLSEDAGENLQETLAIRLRSAEEAQRLRQQYLAEGGSGATADIAGAVGGSATSFLPLIGAGVVGAATRNPVAALATQRGLATIPAAQAYADSYAQFKAEYPNAPDADAHRYAASMAGVEYGLEAIVPAAGALTGTGARQVASAVARRVATEAATEGATEAIGQGIQLGLAPALAPESLGEAAYNIGIAGATGGLVGGAVSLPTTALERSNLTRAQRVEQARLAQLASADETGKMAEGAALVQEIEQGVESGTSTESPLGRVRQDPRGPSSPFLPRVEGVDLETPRGEATSLLQPTEEVLGVPRGPVSVLPDQEPSAALGFNTPRGEATPLAENPVQQARVQELTQERDTLFQKATPLTRKEKSRVKTINRELGAIASRQEALVDAPADRLARTELPSPVETTSTQPAPTPLPATRAARVEAPTQPVADPTPTNMRADEPPSVVGPTVREDVIDPTTGAVTGEQTAEVGVPVNDTQRQELENFFNDVKANRSVNLPSDQQAAFARIMNVQVPPEQRKATPLRQALSRARTAWDALAGVKAAVRMGADPKIERYDRLIDSLTTEDMKNVGFTLLQPETEARTPFQRALKDDPKELQTKGSHEVDPATGRDEVTIVGDGYARRDGTATVETTLHEIVHAKGAAAIRAVQEGRETDPAIVRAVNNLNDARLKLREAIPKKGLTPDEKSAVEYATTDVNEFHANTMTNPLVQSALKKESLWEPVKNAIRILLGVPRSQKSLLDEVLDASYSLVDAINKRDARTRTETTTPETGVRRAFAGPRAIGADLGKLSDAEARVARGEDAEIVRQETGWFKGKDGKWRFEIDDSQMSWKIPFDQIPESALFKEPVTVKVGDVVDHPELFNAYPELRDISLVKRAGFTDIFKGLQGWFNDDKMEVGLTPYAQDPLSTLLHELQHVVQMKEGFAKGGNESSAFEALTPESKKSLAEDLLAKLAEKMARPLKIRDYLIQSKSSPAVAAWRAAQNREGALMLESMRAVDGSSEKAAILAERSSVEKEIRSLRKAAMEAMFGPTDPARVDRTSPETEASSKIFFQTKEAVDRDISYLEREIVEINKDRVKLESGDLDGLKDVLKKQGGLYQLYKNLAGETEARNVQKRMNLTRAERVAQSPRSTQDVPDEQQIVVEQSVGGDQMSMEGGGIRRPVSTEKQLTARLEEVRSQVLGTGTRTKPTPGTNTGQTIYGLQRKLNWLFSANKLGTKETTEAFSKAQGAIQRAHAQMQAIGRAMDKQLGSVELQSGTGKSLLATQYLAERDATKRSEIAKKIKNGELVKTLDKARAEMDRLSTEVGRHLVEAYAGRTMPESVLDLLKTIKERMGSYLTRAYMVDIVEGDATETYNAYKRGDPAAVARIQPLVNRIGGTLAGLNSWVENARQEAKVLSDPRVQFEASDTVFGREVRQRYSDFLGNPGSKTIKEMFDELDAFAKKIPESEYAKEVDRTVQKLIGVFDDSTKNDALVQFARAMRSDDRTLRRRDRVPADLRLAWGEIINPILSFNLTAERTAAAYANLKSSNYLFDNAPNLFSNREDPQTNRLNRIPNNPTVYGKLAGMYTIPEVHDAVVAQVAMLPPGGAGNDITGMVGNAVAGALRKAQPVLGFNKLTQIAMNGTTSILLNSTNLLYMPLANGNTNITTLPRAMKAIQASVFTAYRSKNINEDFIELLDQGVIDPVQLQTDEEVRNRTRAARAFERGQVVQGTVRDAVRKGITDPVNSLREVVNFLELVPKAWNYFSAKEELRAIYPDLSEQQLRDMAAEQTNRLNPTYTRTRNIVRGMEVTQLSYTANYMEQIASNGARSINLGIVQTKNGLKTGNPRLAIAGLKKLLGNVTALGLSYGLPATVLGILGISPEEEDETIADNLPFNERGMQPVILGVNGDRVVYTDAGRVNPGDTLHAPMRAIISAIANVSSGNMDEAERDFNGAMTNLQGQFAGGAPLGQMMLRLFTDKRTGRQLEEDAPEFYSLVADKAGVFAADATNVAYAGGFPAQFKGILRSDVRQDKQGDEFEWNLIETLMAVRAPVREVSLGESVKFEAIAYRNARRDPSEDLKRIMLLPSEERAGEDRLREEVVKLIEAQQKPYEEMMRSVTALRAVGQRQGMSAKDTETMIRGALKDATLAKDEIDQVVAGAPFRPRPLSQQFASNDIKNRVNREGVRQEKVRLENLFNQRLETVRRLMDEEIAKFD